ncbi:unnamed protein product [[Candida] boidinii]|nr:unnamed protein product [[Candida] boidinii]
MDKSQPDLLATETSNFSLITEHGQSKSSLNPLDTTITEETSPSTATPAAATGTAHQENSTDQGIGQQAYIIDDDFSNIHQQQQQQHIESDDHDSNYFIETSVSSPITDYEGQNPFSEEDILISISYLNVYQMISQLLLFHHYQINKDWNILKVVDSLKNLQIKEQFH